MGPRPRPSPGQALFLLGPFGTEQRRDDVGAVQPEHPSVTTTLLVQQVLNGLLDGVYYLLIALGLSLIFSLGGIVNLAHGGFFAIGAYLTVTLADYLGFGG